MYKKKKDIYLMFGILFLFSLNSIYAFNFEGDGVKIIDPIEANGGIAVSPQDYTGRLVSFYLTKSINVTNLTVKAYETNRTINVSSTVGCATGQALDIYDKESYFQGLIKSVTTNSITFTSQLDADFTDLNNTTVKCGTTNMNVDGATIPIEYDINPPENHIWHIESLGIEFEDNLDWDISTFGSIPALSNGFETDIINGDIQTIFLIYNNAGFLHRGGIIQDIPKAPSGVYGFSVDIIFEQQYGTIIALKGETRDRIVGKINDDLTAQSVMRMVVRGHYANE